MKKTLIVAVVLGSCATSGSAADLYGASAPPLEVRRSFDWSGTYVGAHGGLHWTKADAEISSVIGPLLNLDVENGVFPREIDVSDESFAGGVHAGHNIHFGRWVAGIEGDISWLGQNADTLFSVIDPGPPPFTGARVNSTWGTEADWLATLRLRGGLALDRNLIYATGGLAVGEVENTFSVAIPSLGYAPPEWSESGTQLGWVLGAGVERAFTSRIVGRLEYLHYDLDDQEVLATDPATFPGQSIEYRFGNSGNLVQLGLNWRF